MIFIETPIFTEDVMDLLSEEEYLAFQIHLTRNPDAGDFIIGTGGASIKAGIMDKQLFERLKVSMDQMNEIERGERPPSREFHLDPLQVKNIRKSTGLSQAAFARQIDVAVGTLRNWEQGRRDPVGPARALL